MRALILENVDMLPSHGVTQTTPWRNRMSTTLLVLSSGRDGSQHVSEHFEEGVTIFCIDQPRDRLRCSQCGSQNVWIAGRTERVFRSLPIGSKPTLIAFDVPRLRCQECHL